LIIGISVGAVMLVTVAVVLFILFKPGSGTSDGRIQASPGNSPDSNITATPDSSPPVGPGQKPTPGTGQTPDPCQKPDPSPDTPPAASPDPPPGPVDDPVDDPTPPPIVYPAPNFTHVYASSVLSAQGENRYDPELAFDGLPETAWSYNGSGDEWIEAYAATDQYVSGVRIMNGYNKYSTTHNSWLYYMNSRPKDIEIKFSDNSSVFYTLEDIFDPVNHIYQDIKLDTPVLTKGVMIYIHSVYTGDRWGDVCISEIDIY